MPSNAKAVLKRKRSTSDHDVDDFNANKRTSVALEETQVDIIKAKDLLRLLDISAITSEAGVSPRFHQIASLLLLDYHLVCCAPNIRCTFEVLEVEFYLIKPRLHEDPFTHDSAEQKQSGQWYFHRAPRRVAGTSSQTPPSAAAGYRGGTRKGLDLTFGPPVSVCSRFFPQGPSNSLQNHIECSPESEISALPRGGILIRSLRRISDGKVISGPSLVVDEILRISEAANIADLVANKWNNDISAFRDVSSGSTSTVSQRTSLYLASRDDHGETANLPRTRPRIYRSPRIGLDLSNPQIPMNVEETIRHPRVKYVSRPYRYFTHPHLLTANGRGQTFLGVYCDDLGLDITPQGSGTVIEASLESVMTQTGLAQHTAQKYLQEYLRGYEGGTLKTFIGAAGKGVSSSPGSFLRMMGALRRAQSLENDLEKKHC